MAYDSLIDSLYDLRGNGPTKVRVRVSIRLRVRASVRVEDGLVA